MAAQVKAKIDCKKATSHTRRAATTLEGDLTNLEDGVAASLQVVKERLDTSDIADLQRISDKAERLSSTLQRDWEQQLKDGTFCGMVFVREVALATDAPCLDPSRAFTETARGGCHWDWFHARGSA